MDVNANPVISLEVRSDVYTQLTLKPIYSGGSDDWLQREIYPDDQWHSYTFDLVNYSGQNLERTYFYLDGGTLGPGSPSPGRHQCHVLRPGAGRWGIQRQAAFQHE
ncbi:hypothetical protein ES703_84865 [subsurface metagenome]